MYRTYLIDRLLIKLRFPKDIVFLEIGCGTGEFLLKMNALGYRGCGVDFADHSIEIARERLSHTEIKVYKKDLMSMNGYFDIIFAFEVLEHIEDDISALIKINHLLNDKGYLTLSVPGRQDLFDERDIKLGHFRRYEKEDLLAKLQEAGFEILTLWSWGCVLFSKLLSFIAKREKKQEDGSAVEKSKKTGYSRPAAQFVKGTFPIYSKFFPLLMLQNLFLESNFLNCNYLVLCRRRKTKDGCSNKREKGS